MGEGSAIRTAHPKASLGFLLGLKLETFLSLLHWKLKAYFMDRVKIPCLKKLCRSSNICDGSTRLQKKKKQQISAVESLENVLFSVKNIWLENQIFWSIRYFLKLLKKFILTQVQIIKPVRSSTCLNFAPRHSPFSMEDIQHYNQASHYQQNRNGQSNHQVDEVLICRCRNKPEMRACQEMNIFHI